MSIYRPPARLASAGTLRSWCFVVAIFSAFAVLPARPAAHPAAPVPLLRIPVDPLGYRPIGSLYLLLRQSSLTLNFIDESHLLFTFHQFRLMEREVEQGHDDQNIHAVVVDLPSGSVNATAEWRLHDRRAYLYPLEKGTFLVRQGNDLFRTGADLHLHPYLRFNQRLLTAQVSPDGQLLTVQSDLERHSSEKHQRLLQEAMANGESVPDEDVQIQMIRLDHRKIIGQARAEAPLKLAVAPAGFIDQEQIAAGKWKVRVHPFTAEEENRAEDRREKKSAPRAIYDIASTCMPTDELIGSTTVLLTTCSARSADRFVTAINLDGQELWTGQWSARYVWPTLALDATGQNFAISWLRISHPVDTYDPLSDTDIQGQTVQVLSTRTGHLLLAVNASPVVSAGQNFALSADGSRLAVLNNGALEVYAVPADTAR